MQGNFFCSDKPEVGMRRLESAFHLAKSIPEIERCEVEYATGIACLASDTISTRNRGRTILYNVHITASCFPYCLQDLRRETIRMIPSNELVFNELPPLECSCLLSKCACKVMPRSCLEPPKLSIYDAAQCCKECLTTAEYMMFRHELYVKFSLEVDHVAPPVKS